MQLNIDGHHIQITDSLRNYVESKLHRVERHAEHITSAHLVMTVDKTGQRAEAQLHVSGADIFADATSDDMYTAIDALMDKLDRQVVKHKQLLHRPFRIGRAEEARATAAADPQD